jgi:hypothetical protein
VSVATQTKPRFVAALGRPDAAAIRFWDASAC